MTRVFDPSVKCRQDYDWTIRACQKYTFCIVSEPLVDIFLQEDSISRFDVENIRVTMSTCTANIGKVFPRIHCLKRRY